MESQQKSLLVVVIGILVLAMGFACVGGAAVLFVVSRHAPQPIAPQPQPQPGGAPTQPARGGRFSGRVMGPDGGPIRVAGAKAEVTISGVTGRGENVSFSPPVGPDGAFDLSLVEGIYHPPRATLVLPVDGKTFRFELLPIPHDTTDRPSEQGIARDFAWKLSGPRPGVDADPRNHTRWFGGSIKMGYEFYRNDIKKAVPPPPGGTKVTFTLAPKSPLLDGSPGRTLTFERDYDSSFTGLENNNLPDIPVATYALTGFETLPDGTRRPLLIQKAYAEFVPEREIKLEPDQYGGVWCPIIGFTRPE